MSETEKFQFADWSVEVHRRAFRRTVGIYLSPQKPIKVVAAKSTPTKEIVSFLLLKKPWIEKNFQKFKRLEEQFPEKKFVSLETFPFLGTERTLKVVITFQKKPFVSLTEEHLLLHIPRDEWSADTVWQEHPRALEQIRQFYKREAEKLLLSRIQFWSQEMSLFPSQVKFREQRTRWGSCNSSGVISLNWRLIVFAPQIIDYVIIHELAHLKHMNHSNDFWSLVKVFHPNTDSSIEILKQHYRQVEFLSMK